MFCNQCGNKLPENSKFCNKCGSPVVNQEHKPVANTQHNDIFSNSLHINEPQKVIREINETPKTNYNANNNNEKIRKPSAGLAVILILISFICSIVTIAILKESFLEFLVMLVCTLFLIGFTVNYAQNDFQKYKEKVIRNRETERAQKEAEQRRQKEFEAKRREYRAKGIPTCPNCGSHSIATMNRGYSIVWGFIGSGKPVNVCQVCGHKWSIGK